MKLSAVIETIVSFLNSGATRSGTVHISGNLPSTEPTLRKLLETSPNYQYRHSAMPLLELEFQAPVALELTTSGIKQRAVIHIMKLYHDSIWLSRSKAANNFVKLHYPDIQNIHFEPVTQDERKQIEVENFLDEIG